jgi:hypothetical protein
LNELVYCYKNFDGTTYKFFVYAVVLMNGEITLFKRMDWIWLKAALMGLSLKGEAQRFSEKRSSPIL